MRWTKHLLIFLVRQNPEVEQWLRIFVSLPKRGDKKIEFGVTKATRNKKTHEFILLSPPSAYLNSRRWKKREVKKPSKRETGEARSWEELLVTLLGQGGKTEFRPHQGEKAVINAPGLQLRALKNPVRQQFSTCLILWHTNY